MKSFDQIKQETQGAVEMAIKYARAELAELGIVEGAEVLIDKGRFRIDAIKIEYNGRCSDLSIALYGPKYLRSGEYGDHQHYIYSGYGDEIKVCGMDEAA